MEIQNQLQEVSNNELAHSLPRSPLIPKNVKEAFELATILSKSSIVPQGFAGKPESVFICISFGMELGLPPLQALQNIYVVNNKPTIYGDAALALASEYPSVEMIDEDAPDVAMKNSCGRCAVKLKSGQVIERRFSVEDAKKAGLWGKSGPWTQYTGRMLMLRARSWAIRDAVPGCLKGMQIREEVDDYPVRKTIQMPQERTLVQGEVIPSPDEVNVVVIPKTTEERLVMAKEAYATTYQATEQEMQVLISEYVAENDGNVTDESTLQFLNTLWTKLKKGEATAEVLFKRGVAQKGKK